MPPGREVSHLLSFDGGLNTVDPPSEIKDNELLIADNLWYPDGKLVKRPGFLKLTASPFVTTNKLVILGFNPLSGRYIISTLGDTKIWEVSGSGNIIAVTGTITQVARWTLSISGTTYLGFDSTMAVRTLVSNAISGTAITNSPASQVSAYHKGRIFTDVFATQRIAFSEPITPTTPVATWQTTSLLDVGVGDDNSNITALASLGDLLIIFKARSTWVLYVQGTSPADWVLRKIANIGAAPGSGNASTFVYDNTLYFISSLGIYKTNGSSFQKISKNIWVPQDPSFLYNTAFPFGQHRITRWLNSLIISGYTYPPIFPESLGYTYVYNLGTGAWTKWTFLGSVGGFEDVWSMDGDALYVVDDSLNFYYASSSWMTDARYESLLSSNINIFSDGLLNTTLGAGDSYLAKFKTKKFTNSMDNYLRLMWAGVEYKSYASPSFQFIWDEAVQTPANTPGFNSSVIKAYKLDAKRRCRTFSLQCEYSGNSPFEFYRADFRLRGKVPVAASGVT